MDKKMYDKMYDERFKEEILVHLKARTPILHIKERESDESRFSRFIYEFCKINSFRLFEWDCVLGLREGINFSDYRSQKEPLDQLKDMLSGMASFCNHDTVKKYQEQGVRGDIYLIYGIEFYLSDPVISRYLQIIYNNPSFKTIMFFGLFDISSLPTGDLIHTIEAPYPNKDEYEEVFDITMDTLKNHKNIKKELNRKKEIFLEHFEDEALSLSKAQQTLCLESVTEFLIKKDQKNESKSI